jgi:hypothetical protein
MQIRCCITLPHHFGQLFCKKDPQVSLQATLSLLLLSSLRLADKAVSQALCSCRHQQRPTHARAHGVHVCRCLAVYTVQQQCAMCDRCADVLDFNLRNQEFSSQLPGRVAPSFSLSHPPTFIAHQLSPPLPLLFSYT